MPASNDFTTERIKETLFLCIDDVDSDIYGDQESGQSRRLSIQLERCNDKSNCKSKKVADKVLKGSRLVILAN